MVSFQTGAWGQAIDLRPLRPRSRCNAIRDKGHLPAGDFSASRASCCDHPGFKFTRCRVDRGGVGACLQAGDAPESTVPRQARDPELSERASFSSGNANDSAHHPRFQWDLARQVERLDFLLRLLPRYADWGYQELYLHLEDAVEYPSLPGVARSDAYSHRQFARLVDAATRAGIAVVPIVNLLGHTQYLIKVPELRDLNELRDASGRPARPRPDLPVASTHAGRRGKAPSRHGAVLHGRQGARRPRRIVPSRKVPALFRGC